MVFSCKLDFVATFTSVKLIIAENEKFRGLSWELHRIITLLSSVQQSLSLISLLDPLRNRILTASR